mmetsp:Transcript_83411/g.131730  ORF Transcript_83411/g.131730 Transcript_83411/m.131730 type:complete len:171 (-) Transcript_83411:185-697(-)|eukprot:CAMPEP_0169131062 /NCGR_PEP_ID=MMETSP1015-20121227/38048_1 /TAXON_ID=342587 /ORGANISM="Karlodinium micrum, Strain CCMP2283" /LENGTH=170 /DNA_ID=CAMNT_0009195301 /DNA_START=58 /DNA_END=570 /DNA_ORIENTATION=-
MRAIVILSAVVVASAGYSRGVRTAEFDDYNTDTQDALGRLLFAVNPGTPMIARGRNIASGKSKFASAAAPKSHMSRSIAPSMNLFGLGLPELGVIAVALTFILGPDQLKSMAKELGKVSADLKEVPAEFNKGIEIGAQERAQKQGEKPALAETVESSAEKSVPEKKEKEV